MKQKFKFGNECIELMINGSHEIESILPKKGTVVSESEEDVVRNAFANPIGKGLIQDEINPGETVCILVNDITRLTKSEVFIPILVEILNDAGIPDEDIHILFANGLHTQMSETEMRHIITDGIFERTKTHQHDCVNAEFDYIGTTSYDNEVYVNRIARQFDKLILTGGIIVHHLAGFGGGRKDIIPGCARKDTVLHNHKMIVTGKAQSGTLDDNPVHQDFMQACGFIDPAYLFNVILDDDGNIYQAVAGDWREAYAAGCDIARELYLYPISEKADIVIASYGGFPKDIDLRQSKKGFYNASKAVKPGGTIICLAECAEGISREGELDPFEEWLDKYRTLDAIKDEFKENVDMGGLNAYRVREVQEVARLILITGLDVQRLKEIEVEAYQKNEAQKIVDEVLGIKDKQKVILMPQAGLTLPWLESRK